MKKRKLLRNMLLCIIAFFAICIGVIWKFQGNLLFYPFHDENAYNEIKQSGQFDEIVLQGQDGQLTGWLRMVNSDAPILLYFGGRQQCASDMFQFVTDNEHWEYYEGFNFLCIDYPGYGLSDGTPSDLSMYKMADNIFQYIQNAQELNCKDTTVFGYSIGTGVATYYASQYSVDGVILLAPYKDGISLFNKQVNIFHGPLRGLVRNRFNSVEYANDIEVPALIIISKADIYMDYDDALELVEAFGAESDVMIFDDVDHDYFFREASMLEAVYTYLHND